MITKLIALLQWIESSESLKKWLDLFFSFSFMVMSMAVLYKILRNTILNGSFNFYGYYYEPSGRFLIDNSITNNTWIFFSVLFLLVAILGMYLYGIYKKITKKDFSLVRVIMNGVLPFTVGILLIDLYTSSPISMKWYITTFGGLYVLSSISLFLSAFERINKGIIKKIFDLSKKYIIAFLIGLAIYIPLYALANISREFRYMDIMVIFIYGFFYFCAYTIVVWFILTYAWMELDEVSETSWKNILRSGVTIAFIFLIIWISPDLKTNFIEGRIDSAQSIITKEGMTKGGIEKASNIWFLKWAFKEKYLAHSLYGNEKELYAALYDTTIESMIDGEIDADSYKSRTSNATSMLAKGENAKVELNFAKHESEILSDISAVKTTVTYEFQNTTTTNQEVVFNIILPNTESTMTDLSLGSNLEFTGVIAPRGAASKVYQDSLRRNTDPALLEQTGPISYRLRVFPVTPINNSKTQGRQRVQFSYISPLTNDGVITIIPKTDILNLKLTEKSQIITRVTKEGKALVQDSQVSNDLNTLLEGKIEKLEIIPGKAYSNYCSVNNYPSIDIKNFSSIEKKVSKNIVFFDISKSVGEKPGMKKQLQLLVDTWKNMGIILDIYSYNFDVYSNGYDINTFDFWGTTDMSKVIEYIDKNVISDANIVIITDDNSYEKANTELKSIDYKRLKSNRISLIQIGKKIRTMKPEITKSILATDGNIILLDEKSDLSVAIKNIFLPEKKIGICENYSGANITSLAALQGYSDGRKVFGESISSTHVKQLGAQDYTINTSTLPFGSTPRQVYIEEQTTITDNEILEKIATSAHIVTQSTSLIALETEGQKKDLERYSTYGDKYETQYENFDNTSSSSSSSFGWREGRTINTSMAMDSSRGSSVFGQEKAISPLSSQTNSFRGDSMNLDMRSSASGSSSIGFIQLIVVIILFPGIAWFILGRKMKVKPGSSGNTKI